MIGVNVGGNWKRLERLLLTAGGSARWVKGEREWSHPACRRRVRFSVGRKDSSRAACLLLKRALSA